MAIVRLMTVEIPAHLLVRGARPAGALGLGPVDLRLRDGYVVERGERLRPKGAEVVDASGTWVVPGLWDQHVHMGQWAAVERRVDVTGTEGPEEVVSRIATHLATAPFDPEDEGTLLEGYGWRLAGWSRLPSTAELDAVCGDRPVVLISGDCHGGWLSTAAYRALGEPVRPGHVDEDEWFGMWSRLGELPQNQRAIRDSTDVVLRRAASRGVVGFVDLEYGGRPWREWPRWVAAGFDQLRIRPATYPPTLDEVLDDGLASGDVLDESGLVTMGPLKIISDGSLNTRTAFCCEPFVTDDVLPKPFGKVNVPLEQLTSLLRRAAGGGLSAAVHAIGDAALSEALHAYAASGASGTIEHAQLVRMEDLPRMAALGVAASVQPAHLLDDRDIMEALWPDRLDRCFAFASMRDAGVELRMGSDAPVARLDPWETMAAAVHRSGDERPPWMPDQALSPNHALAASTDGGWLRVGERGDLALLAEDPFLDVDVLDPAASADAAAHLRGARVVTTLVGGRVTHQA